MPKKKTKYYYAIGMATPYLYDKPKIHLTARIKKDWAFVYHKRNRIFDCNLVFFKAHFVRER